jgi:hypothetical protein
LLKLELKPQLKSICEGQLAIPRLEHLKVPMLQFEWQMIELAIENFFMEKCHLFEFYS